MNIFIGIFWLCSHLSLMSVSLGNVGNVLLFKGNESECIRRIFKVVYSKITCVHLCITDFPVGL